MFNIANICILCTSIIGIVCCLTQFVIVFQSIDNNGITDNSNMKHFLFRYIVVELSLEVLLPPYMMDHSDFRSFLFFLFVFICNNIQFGDFSLLVKLASVASWQKLYIDTDTSVILAAGPRPRLSKIRMFGT